MNPLNLGSRTRVDFFPMFSRSECRKENPAATGGQIERRLGATQHIFEERNTETSPECQGVPWISGIQWHSNRRSSSLRGPWVDGRYVFNGGRPSSGAETLESDTAF